MSAIVVGRNKVDGWWVEYVITTAKKGPLVTDFQQTVFDLLMAGF